MDRLHWEPADRHSNDVSGCRMNSTLLGEIAMPLSEMYSIQREPGSPMQRHTTGTKRSSNVLCWNELADLLPYFPWQVRKLPFANLLLLLPSLCTRPGQNEGTFKSGIPTEVARIRVQPAPCCLVIASMASRARRPAHIRHAWASKCAWPPQVPSAAECPYESEATRKPRRRLGPPILSYSARVPFS